VAIPVETVGLAAALVVPSIASASSSSSAAAARHKPAANGGSVSLTLTSPKAVTRSKDVRVNCSDVNGVYRAGVKLTRHHRSVRVRVRVPSYTGPGTYAKSRVIVRRPHHTAVRRPKAPAVITSTGGSYTFDRTVKFRHRKIHVAGTAAWTCSSKASTTS
jgi:hypothetical protein